MGSGCEPETERGNGTGLGMKRAAAAAIAIATGTAIAAATAIAKIEVMRYCYDLRSTQTIESEKTMMSLMQVHAHQTEIANLRAAWLISRTRLTQRSQL
jgi:hypothetical protein